MSRLRVWWAIASIALGSLAIPLSAAAQPAPAAGAEDDVDALDDAAIQLYREGKYSEASGLAQRALELREKALGADHPNVAISLNNLALVLNAEGRHNESEQVYKRALAINEKALGPDHPDVGRSLNNLAELYRDQARYAEAEPLLKRSVAIREQALGPEHPSVAVALNNLALVYQAKGRYTEAEPLFKRSLAINETALGPEHPQLGNSLNNLAVLYRLQGKYAEAEPLLKRDLTITEKALGPEHPTIAGSLNNLAVLYRTQGRHSAAEPLLERSRAILEKTFGPEHPLVGTVLNGLAVVYREQGRHTEAESLFKRSLAIREKALSPEHPDVGISRNNLASLYHEQGRYADAETLYRHSLTVIEKALGSEHPDFAASLSNLAEVYRAQGRLAEAEPLLERSLAIVEKSFGPEHPLVATPLNNLALVYRADGRIADAEPLFTRSLAIMEKKLGADHPDLGSPLNNLAMVYRARGRSSDSEVLLKRSIALTEKAFGPEHSSLGSSLNNLALLYQDQRHFTDAEALYKRSLALWEKSLGPDHAEVGTLLNNLAWLALAQDDIAGAAAFWRRSTALYQRRAERGLGDGTGESSRGEAQRYGWIFDGLVKVTQRLATDGHGDAGQLAEEMFSTAQWGRGSDAAASLAQMAARSAVKDPALGPLVRERQDLVAEWHVKDKLLIQARSRPPVERQADMERELSERLSAIDTRLAEVDARFKDDFPDYAALASPRPMSAVKAQEALGDDEALVLFLDTDARFKPLPEETFMWVVTAAEARWVRVEVGTEALGDYVAALRCGLDDAAWKKEGDLRCRTLLQLAARPAKDQPLPFSPGIAHELYEALFGQVADLIKGKHLLIVPSGALTRLPFQVLVTEPPQSEGLAKVRWLARDHAITILPSVASLQALRRVGRPSAAERPMIGFGNPLLDGLQADPEDGAAYKERAELARSKTSCSAPARLRTALWRGSRRGPVAVPQSGGLASLDYLRVQPPLPETADELCAVARDLKADLREIRIGARATETEVKRLSASGDLARYRVVLFATHGTLAGQLKGTSEPGLIMTPPETATAGDDGYLSASEIASLKLDAEWVILSACNTAGPEARGDAAEALSGLARAFIYAGARALLVSHWQVESDVTVKLISIAAREKARDAKLGRAEALRRSMLKLIDSGDELERHPANWAPFVLVGEGGAGR